LSSRFASVAKPGAALRAFRRKQGWTLAEVNQKTGLPVSIADDPLASVVLGTGKMLSDFKLLRKISID